MESYYALNFRSNESSTSRKSFYDFPDRFDSDLLTLLNVTANRYLNGNLNRTLKNKSYLRQS